MLFELECTTTVRVNSQREHSQSLGLSKVLGSLPIAFKSHHNSMHNGMRITLNVSFSLGVLVLAAKGQAP